MPHRQSCHPSTLLAEFKPGSAMSPMLVGISRCTTSHCSDTVHSVLSSLAVEQSLLFSSCLLFRPCRADQVDALASFAEESLGGIDIWVNNAGLSQSSKSDIADTDPSLLQGIVGTNLLGSMWGSRAAIRSMKGTSSGQKSALLACVMAI